MSEKYKSFLANMIIGALVTVLVYALNRDRGYPISQQLCDGFFVAAVLLLGFGGLKFARNQGIFDIMTYSVGAFFNIHLPFTKMDKPLDDRREDFVDYKERKRSVRKSPVDILMAGLVYLVLSCIMLAVYSVTTGV